MNDDMTMGGTPTDKTDWTDNLPGSGLMAPIADAAEDAVTMAKENAGLVIVGGVAVGLLAAALLPRSKKKKIAKRSRKIAALVSELSAALVTQTSDGAGMAADKLAGMSKSMGDTVAGQTKDAKHQASKIADAAADQLNDSGKAIARTLIKLVEKVRSS